MSDRNLNPHAEARVAMALWSDRYSKQSGGCMDFYDGLTAAQKSTCARIVDGIIYADRADGRTPAPLPNVVGGEPVAEIVSATTPAAEILFGRDIKFLVDQRDIPIGTKLYAEPSELPVGGAPTHRHKKRGSTYTLIGIGKMQAENWEEREYGATDEPTPGVSVDMREVAIYRSTDDGSLWVRPREEFEDGRFEAISASEV